MSKVVPRKVGWAPMNKGAIRNWPLKKIQGFEAWFYDGPSAHFGHKPNPKKGKK